MNLHPGDTVWYWARRKGERAHVKTAIVQTVNTPPGMVRVQPIHEAASIPAQTVQIIRLRRGPAPEFLARRVEGIPPGQRTPEYPSFPGPLTQRDTVLERALARSIGATATNLEILFDDEHPGHPSNHGDK